MQKDSIKREQSQAGLSFAERKNFRTKVKRNRLLLLLALLLTAATGAWAQEPTTYSVKMKDGTQDAKNWTIASGEKSAKGDAADGLTGLSEKDAVTLTYTGRLKVKGVKATSDAAPAAGKTVDLSTLTASYEAQNGDVLTNATTTYRVTIAAGATVTLDGVNISSSAYCIKCLGDATIILKDGSTNTLTSTTGDYPALSIGDANTTLTIQGSTGVLNVTSGNYCAGIGGGYSNTNKTCGNIRIEGGVITAQGGGSGAGIGTDAGEATCGDIIITGGTITAKGGSGAAGIGTGNGTVDPVVCGGITIANTVTKVTATKGNSAPNSIGKGYGDNATCGTVTIGGTKYWENNAAVNGGDTYLAQATIEYPAPAGPTGTPLDNTTTAWADGSTYAVPAGGLTYSAAITVSGAVTLVLTDGETLTLNKGISLAEGATLTVEGEGTMTVNGTNGSTASTVAGTGTLILTSGTLNATGGNGADAVGTGSNITANAGGVAINGAVTVSGGTLTATGGNGGSITGQWRQNCKGGAGGAAISGALTINDGTVTTTNGTNGSVASNNFSCTAGAGGAAAAGGVTDNR